MKIKNIIFLSLILISSLLGGCKNTNRTNEKTIEDYVLNNSESINDLSSYEFSFKAIYENMEIEQKYSYNDDLKTGYYCYYDNNNINSTYKSCFDYYMMVENNNYYELYNNDNTYSAVKLEEDSYLYINRLFMFNDYVKNEIAELNKKLLQVVYDISYDRYTYCDVLEHEFVYNENKLDCYLILELIGINSICTYEMNFTFEDYVLTNMECISSVSYIYMAGIELISELKYEIDFSNSSSIDKVKLENYSLGSNIKDEINFQYGYNIDPYLENVYYKALELNRIDYEITSKGNETNVKRYAFDKYNDCYYYLETIDKKKQYEYYLVIEGNEYVQYNVLNKTRIVLNEEEFKEMKENIVNTVLYDIRYHSESMIEKEKSVYSNNLFDCCIKQYEDYRKGEINFKDLYLIGYDYYWYDYHKTLNVTYNAPISLPSFEEYIGG